RRANRGAVAAQVVDRRGCKREDISSASAKEGRGIREILDAVVDRVRPPSGDPEAPLQAMIFDSVFNSFRGVEVYFRVFNGTIRTRDVVKFIATKRTYEADEIGILKLQQQPVKEIKAGNVGYLISGIKVASEVKVGDTITHVRNPGEA